MSYVNADDVLPKRLVEEIQKHVDGQIVYIPRKNENSFSWGEKSGTRENKRKQYEKGYYKKHPCNETFTCKNCGRPVVPEGAGSNHRNHCPNCLYSLHVDIEPGDRESDCGGHMEPVSVWVRKNGEWLLSTGARCVGHLVPIGLQRMIIQ